MHVGDTCNALLLLIQNVSCEICWCDILVTTLPGTSQGSNLTDWENIRSQKFS